MFAPALISTHLGRVCDFIGGTQILFELTKGDALLRAITVFIKYFNIIFIFVLYFGHNGHVCSVFFVFFFGTDRLANQMSFKFVTTITST